MPSLNLAFCLHNHQPAGNFDHIIEHVYTQAYRPFLDVLQRHPEMKVVLHYSGFLLHWLDAHHPDLLDTVRNLISRGQVEMITGGFYEPILPIIPDRDKLGQIGLLTDYLQQRLNGAPQGLWLTERVWHPSLIRPLKQAGVAYTIVDDNNFSLAGVSEQGSLGHFTVGHPDSETIEVFPINRSLRQALPFESPEQVLDRLRGLAGDDHRLAVFADDGEKFGEWPGTHEHVYTHGWLDRFFDLLRDNSDWLRVTTLRDFYSTIPPAGHIDLPPGSYPEMMQWSGGSWWNFLDRYSESNLLHRKMLLVSDLVSKMDEGDRAAQARDRLYRGQSNDPYWHGVFGGLYLLHLRTANYRSLLQAENLARPADGLTLAQTDFDGDGRDEVLLASPHLNCYLHPIGGQIFELDHRPAAWNFLATLMRRREPYHQQDINPDWYPRRALIDHFFKGDVILDAFAASQYGEQGDFVNQPYEVDVSESDGQIVVTLRRDGGAWVGTDFAPIALTKTLTFRADSPEIRVEYRLQHSGKQPLPLWFGCEINATLSAGQSDGRHYAFLDGHLAAPDDRTAHSALSEISLVDEWVGSRLTLRLDQPADLWTFPVQTISQGLDGTHTTYQSSAITPHWRLTLRPDEPWTTLLIISLETTD